MKRALIVWGGWPGHSPEQVAGIKAEMLAAAGMAVTVTADISALGADDIGSYDLVVPVVTDGEIEREHAIRLGAAVRAGTGLAGAHGALATSFRRSVQFHYVAGVQWVAHPGDIIDFRVDIAETDDPIVAGIGSFPYRSEQYYLHYDPSVEILATTTFTGEHDPAVAGVVMPVVFKRHFGQGRVFYSALGHTVEEYAHPQALEILRRGLLWAVR